MKRKNKYRIVRNLGSDCFWEKKRTDLMLVGKTRKNEILNNIKHKKRKKISY